MWSLVLYSLPLALLLSPALLAAPLVFRCAPTNDLYAAVAAAGQRPARYNSIEEALRKARRGAAVLLLADEYPQALTPITAAHYQTAARKQLRLFVEYPALLPGSGSKAGEPRQLAWERGVVASDAFAPALTRLRILGLHQARFVPITPAPSSAALVFARVAGFDTAVYGLPPRDVYPLLFEQQGVLIATSKLSQFVSARYAPSDAWEPIWNAILARLTAPAPPPSLRWPPAVRPSYSASATLPANAEAAAFRRGVDAYANARFFVHASWKDEVPRRGTQNDSVGAAPLATWPNGDGSEGLLEGFSSSIFPDGSQPIRWNLRADCIGEASFPLALASLTERRPDYARIAANLNDFLYQRSSLTAGPRADAASPAYGLIGWSIPQYEGVYYGDDNARALLGTIGAAAAIQTDRWDLPILRALLANLRTTGRNGFRGYRLDHKPLTENGWQRYWNGDRIHYAPHYEAYPWAMYLWAWHKTGYRPFLDRAKTAIRMTMAAYPSQWKWANGMQQERARMLLPLAWLLRIEDTAEHRVWLHRIATDLLRHQHASGAIGEELGDPALGAYGPPKSNEEYGKSEATLVQQNGDPLADLLYTSNFAFLGLHEAAAATGDARYKDAAARLAAFFVRIQIQSQARRELNGWWFRAFDFRRWEYWASNADAGWGAWSTESGWTQSWITAVLGMRRRNTSLWELTANSQVRRHLDQLLPAMFP